MKTCTKFSEGRVYQFIYDGAKRAALVLEDNGTCIQCYEFTKEDYRNYRVSKIQGEIKDVTSKCTIEPYNGEKHDRYQDAGMKCYDYDNNLYVVNV